MVDKLSSLWQAKNMKTVNVIEIVDGTIQGLKAFPDNVKGNKQALKYFVKMYTAGQGSGRGPNLTSSQITDSLLADGRFDFGGGYEAFLVHSK